MNPKKHSILVVEDSKDLCTVLQQFFELEGFEVTVAMSGKEALSLMETRKVDVVLSDIRMPEGNGLELLDRIRGEGKGQPLVLLMTGYADVTSEEVFHHGASGFFHKPFDPEEVLETISRGLKDERERWQMEPDSVRHIEMEISREFSSIEEAMRMRALHLGRGGMFVAQENHFPKIGSHVSFRARFKDGAVFAGIGVIRWTRGRENPELPAGMGVEWLCFEPEHRERMLEMVRAFQSASFIPRV